VDFLTPLVNDPYEFGRIAAANSLSDVYAMGGEPWAAMNIVCFPQNKMPGWVLREILRGGRDQVLAAGAAPAGGHSVSDEELKFGLAVSGAVDPDKLAIKGGLRPGDALVLTKPIGTGVLATAIKAQWEGWQEFEALIVRWCGRLNAGGARVIRELSLRAATDVTGFGLGGHLLEMAQSAGLAVEIELSAVPFLEPVPGLAAMGLLPGGSLCNRRHYAPKTEAAPGLDPILTDLVFDAQTSGGLLLGVPEHKLDQAVALLRENGDLAAVIGRAAPADPARPPLRIA
jgi:selenide,water dikinase